MVCHCVCEAADDGFCYVCESRDLLAVTFSQGGVALDGGRLGGWVTFVFGLCASFVARDHVLFVDRSHGLEIH